MNFSRRSIACAVVVAAAHGINYSAWAWQPADAGTTNLHPTRAEATTSPARFDSEGPQQEGRFGTEVTQRSDVTPSGVAYFRLEGDPDIENAAIFAHMKDWFVGYQRSQGRVVHELPASAYAANHDRMLARLHEMVATIGDDFAVVPFSVA